MGCYNLGLVNLSVLPSLVWVWKFIHLKFVSLKSLDGIRGVRRGLEGLKWWSERGPSYEGLPPEVGAFNSQKSVHAPWPVHNFGYFGHFFDVLSSRGVGVIPWVPGWMDGW